MALKPYKRERPGVNEIARVNTNYDGRPDHRGHTVLIDGWNDQHVMLIIISDDKTNEALVTPGELRKLADAAEAELSRW